MLRRPRQLGGLPRPTLPVLASMLVALVVRACLAPRYYGWEEGDYGNLMMVREVMDSGFTWFRASHMPGWYSLGALVRLLIPDARTSALLLTMAFSVGSVGVAAAIAGRVAGPGAALFTGLILAIQPEMALYGASTLRSPVFTCLGLLGLWALLANRPVGFAFTSLAFLTRMEGFFIFYAPALLAWGTKRRAIGGRLLAPTVVLGGAVFGWQLYISLGLHEYAPFWAGPLGQNQTSGDSRWLWVQAGARTVWALLSWTLPRKLSWPLLLLAALGTWTALRGGARPGARTVVVYALFGVGFWCAEGFLAQHDANHNLYWIWLLPAVPLVVILAAVGLGAMQSRLPRVVRGLAATLALVSVGPTFLHELRYQMQRSQDWYRPQLDLARWLEEHARPGAGLVLGSIPEVWVQRRAHPFRVSSWWFLPQRLKHQGPEEFFSFLDSAGVDYVMWFAEEWTEAPAIAPYLASGDPVQVGSVRLLPVDREDGYGWILYVVERDGHAPSAPPPYGQGAPGPGWSR